MNQATGEILYRYTVRNGKLFVREGRVVLRYGNLKFVYFTSSNSGTRYPRENEFGVISAKGPSVWMTERNDEFVKRLFIEYEEQKLVELQRQIVRKTELIKMLKEGSD